MYPSPATTKKNSTLIALLYKNLTNDKSLLQKNALQRLLDIWNDFKRRPGDVAQLKFLWQYSTGTKHENYLMKALASYKPLFICRRWTSEITFWLQINVNVVFTSYSYTGTVRIGGNQCLSKIISHVEGIIYGRIFHSVILFEMEKNGHSKIPSN